MKTIVKEDNVWVIVAKSLLMIVAGNFTFGAYSMLLNLGAALLVMFIFLTTLLKLDFFSFFVQLFICNHFPFGSDFGGIYNLIAALALIIFIFVNGKSSFFRKSTIPYFSKICLVVLIVIQILSVLNGDGFSVGQKIMAIIPFYILLFLFYFSSKINIAENELIKLIKVIGIFSIYSFIVSVNQNFNYYYTDFAFFPNYDSTAEFQMDIIRSAGTLGNFEAYAEYSLSLFALLIPGILSGSFKQKGNRFYYFCIGILLISAFSIILSGTRSSMLLLPVVFIAACFFVRNRLNPKVVFSIIFCTLIFFVLNANANWIDFELLLVRNENIDFTNLNYSRIISGEDMNRGSVFAYGINKIEHTSGILGEGFYTNRVDYAQVHFGKGADVIIPDYHNLYMSAIVIWGFLGAFAFIYLFFAAIYTGLITYQNFRKDKSYLVDLLIGFNLLFLFLFINQFKIQFIRDANYCLIIFFLLSIYISFIHFLIAKNSINPS